MACTSIPHKEGVVDLIVDSKSPYVDGTIGGEKRRFLFDSGANQAFIKKLPAVIKESDLQSGPWQITAQGWSDDKKIFNAFFRLGDLVFPSVRTLYSTNHKFEAIPMTMLFSDHLIVDFKANKIIMGQKADFCQATEKFKMNYDAILMDVKIGDSSTQVVWDTGAQASFFHRPWLDEKNFTSYYRSDIETVLPDARVKQSAAFYKTTIVIGGQKLPFDFLGMKLDDSFLGLGSDLKGILGFDFIKNKRWYFDMNNKLFCFE